ncbi:MAG TPA: hypothetical protein PK874_14695 [Desulfobacteraceae bacterium]|jgi:peptidoglycan/LPS O-acetylase OafA/YrhL|nr:hypothetical protein [Desulfobacteraceae bacterium]
MKRGIIALLVSAIVLATAAYWFFGLEKSVNVQDILSFGIIIILVGFGIWFAVRRFSAVRSGEPPEDELSKKIVQKSAAWSYYISLYMWVFLIWLKDRVTMDTEQVLGAGILSMAVIFMLCYIFHRVRGVRNE